jgi:hypothetical protein
MLFKTTRLYIEPRAKALKYVAKLNNWTPDVTKETVDQIYSNLYRYIQLPIKHSAIVERIAKLNNPEHSEQIIMGELLNWAIGEHHDQIVDWINSHKGPVTV